MDKKFYSIKDVAELKKVSVEAVLDDIEQERLKAFERCRVSGGKGDAHMFASMGPEDITRIRLEPGQPCESKGWVDDNGYEVTMYHSGRLENIVIDAKDAIGYVQEGVPEVGDPLAKFQNMEDLQANEISLSFLFNNLMEISARGVKRKVPCASLGLLNKHTGNLNKQGVILLGFAQGKTPSKTESKTVSRVRDIFKTLLGVKADPFQTDWMPHFIITDNSDAPDKRAAKDAKLVAYNDDALSHVDTEYTFNQDEDDPASEWLEQHD